MSTRIVLASRSPRRRELLAQVGIEFEVRPVDVDEACLPGEAPAAYVERLARAKAAAAGGDPRRPVLGADTAVVCGGDILGKPDDETAALAMLARLSGVTHEVLTGVAVVHGAHAAARVVRSRVTLRPTSPDERRAYWASGEPAGKAGAYAIQGLGAVLVEALAGSYSNVVGLPLFETAALLRDCGVDPLAARAP